MNTPLEQVRLLADLETFDGPRTMGYLGCQTTRGHHVFSFEYDQNWLKRPEALSFDPELQLVTGPQYPGHERGNFGVFLDSAPDRWGRVLMQRRENLRAREGGRRPRTLGDWDFLLGVHDETRLGALRFQDLRDEHFISSDADLAVPPISSLQELQSASLAFETHAEEEDHPEYRAWLDQLLAPGTSLGGARPKATVRDENDRLCVAKFPSRQDRHDVGAWELVLHKLAARTGIQVPETGGTKIGNSNYTTFLSRRFDRTAQGRRRAFVSAMTLTQRTDGEEGASYLELVEMLQTDGARPREDLQELFRRVLFNILAHNTDDHLRNHGFLIGKNGIQLSPAFDLNPTPDRTDLSLAINEVETACEVEIAMDAAKDFGLKSKQADEALAAVREAVAEWRSEAQEAGISRAEIEQMASAFE